MLIEQLLGRSLSGRQDREVYKQVLKGSQREMSFWEEERGLFLHEEDSELLTRSRKPMVAQTPRSEHNC